MTDAELGRETAVLLDYLGGQRRHVLGILDGLDEDALRRAVLPSGWSCLGLVHHLTVDVELFWFGAVVAGDSEAIAELDRIADDGWLVPEGATAPDVLAGYRRQCDRSDEVIRASDLDAAPAWWPTDLFGDAHVDDVREVVLHVIAETAAHAGHLDAARELIDGRLWMVLTG
jgi:hypothetical protein